MSWDISKNRQFFQKKYGKHLVRKMGDQFWVINLDQFAGMIALETKSLKEAINYAKT